MFCEKCGIQIEDDSKFCSNCSTNIYTYNTSMESSEKVKYEYTKSAKPIPLAVKLIFFIIIAFIIAGIVLFFVGKSYYNPENTAKDYFLQLNNQCYDKAYDYLLLPNSPFVTKQLFIKSMNKMYKDKKKNTIKILNVSNRYSDEQSPLSYNDSQEYTIKYTEGDSQFIKESVVTLLMQPTKKWFLYPEYKIPLDIIDKKQLQVPSGAVVFVDGIEMDKTYYSNNITNVFGNTKDVYDLENLIIGPHSFSIKFPYTKEFSKEEELAKLSSDTIYFSEEELEITEDDYQELIVKAQEFLKLYCKQVTAGKTFDTIEKYVYYGEYFGELRENYNNTVDHYKDKEFDLKTINFSYFKSGRNRNFNDGMTINMNLTYKYTYSIIKKSNKDKVSNITNPLKGNMNIEFINVENKWMINNFDIPNIIFNLK